MAVLSARRDSAGSSQPARRKWSFPWARTVNPMRHESPVSRLISYHLDPQPGMRIADIGAGAGYWTFRLANAVGDGGHVYATDRGLDCYLRLRREKRQRGLDNVTVIWAWRHRPGLPPSSVDTVLTVDTYLFDDGHRRRGGDYLRRCAQALHPGGRMIIVNSAVHTTDWTPDFGRPLRHSQSSAENVIAMGEPGFAVEARETLPVRGARGELPGYLLVLRRQQSHGDPPTVANVG